MRKTLFLAVLLSTALFTGCTEPTASVNENAQANVPEWETEASAASDEEVAVDVAATEDSENYVDEGSEGNNGALFIDHFKVNAQPNFDDPDQITIQKITDGEMRVTGISVNRGNCALLSNPDPTTMGYSSKMTVYLYGCDMSDVLEVEVSTDDGYATYNF